MTVTTDELAEIVAKYITQDLMPVANSPMTKFVLGFAEATLKKKPEVLTNIISQYPIFDMAFKDADGYDADALCDILEEALKVAPFTINLKTETFEIPSTDINKIKQYIKEVKNDG